MDFGAFLADSLRLMEAEIPHLYGRLAATLGRRDVRVQVDGPAFHIRSDGNHVRIVDPGESPSVELTTTGRDILSLLDAESTLLASALADRLRLRGRADELVVFHDALMVYLGAAVRAPGFVGLRDRFRSEVEE